jgi:hypothetical protein
MEPVANAYTILVFKEGEHFWDQDTDGRILLKCYLKQDVKMCTRLIPVQWRVLSNTVTNHRVPWKVGNIFTSRATIGFSMVTPFHCSSPVGRHLVSALQICLFNCAGHSPPLSPRSQPATGPYL